MVRGPRRRLHVRLDEASAAALEVVRAEGLNDSEAVRTALREAAARRRSRSADARLRRADWRRTPTTARRCRPIREQMDELAPPLGG